MRIGFLSLVVAGAMTSAGCNDSSTTGSSQASLGCGDGMLAAGTSTFGLRVDGRDRNYEIYVPESYDGAIPMLLVLNFHGFTSNAAQQAFFSDMNATADERGFLVAYPNGVDNSWNGGVCCGNATTEDIDDVAFTRAVIDDIGDRGCIDLKRVYATGMSNGGFMSHRLACEAADVIAAVAPVAGTLGIPAEDCNPSRPIPLIHMYGVQDRLVSYEELVPPTQAAWVEKNGCSGEPDVEVTGTTTCETLTNCAGGVTLTLCSIENHDHCWPGQEFCPFEPNVVDFSANDAMLDLFETVSLP